MNTYGTDDAIPTSLPQSFNDEDLVGLIKGCWLTTGKTPPPKYYDEWIKYSAYVKGGGRPYRVDKHSPTKCPQKNM